MILHPKVRPRNTNVFMGTGGLFGIFGGSGILSDDSVVALPSNENKMGDGWRESASL
jgi:hypothetical protein